MFKVSDCFIEDPCVCEDVDTSFVDCRGFRDGIMVSCKGASVSDVFPQITNGAGDVPLAFEVLHVILKVLWVKLAHR